VNAVVEAGSNVRVIEVGEARDKLNMLWNSGAQLSMVTYHLPLWAVEGEIYIIFAYGVDEIVTDNRNSITGKSAWWRSSWRCARRMFKV
jgi:hypothetical protein